MRIVELVNKIKIPISNEESDVLALFESEPIIEKQALSPRQIMLANQLVNKDILYRKNETGRITFQKKI